MYATQLQGGGGGVEAVDGMACRMKSPFSTDIRCQGPILEVSTRLASSYAIAAAETVSNISSLSFYSINADCVFYWGYCSCSWSVSVSL